MVPFFRYIKMSEILFYNSICKNGTSKITVKRSRFFGECISVSKEEDAMLFISEYKKKYSDARHICFAYRLLSGAERQSDDGEPSGSAGKPILDILKGGKFYDTCIAVSRYFGGVLLGVGGLVRAYGEAAELALKNSEFCSFERYSIFEVEAGYADYGKLISSFDKNSAKLLNTCYDEKINVSFAIKEENIKKQLEDINEFSNGTLIPEYKKNIFLKKKSNL